jgi:hypothetical protein
LVSRDFFEARVLITNAGVEKNNSLLKDTLSKGAALLIGDVNTEE